MIFFHVNLYLPVGIGVDRVVALTARCLRHCCTIYHHLVLREHDIAIGACSVAFIHLAERYWFIYAQFRIVAIIEYFQQTHCVTER